MDHLILIFTAIMALGVLGAGNAFLIKLFLKPIETKIDNIEKVLSNHITDTNKKIDEVKAEVKAGQAKVETEIKELRDLILKKL